MSNGRVVNLDNSALLSLLSNAAVVREFPALRNLAKRYNAKRRGCGKCGRARAKARDGIVNDLKRMISAWPQGRKQRLKKLLNADTIRVVVNKRMTEL